MSLTFTKNLSDRAINRSSESNYFSENQLKSQEIKNQILDSLDSEIQDFGENMILSGEIWKELNKLASAQLVRFLKSCWAGEWHHHRINGKIKKIKYYDVYDILQEFGNGTERAFFTQLLKIKKPKIYNDIFKIKEIKELEKNNMRIVNFQKIQNLKNENKQLPDYQIYQMTK